MPRYLTFSQIKTALNRGKSVEFFLGSTCEGQISWLSLTPKQGLVELWRFDVFDDGADDYLDVYSFEMVEPDFLDPLRVFDAASEALSYAAESHAAEADRWVNEGVVQDEYGDLRASQK
ncbi:MAG: hypothetical protein Q7Q71_00035 [Verrucomicrobiota bacterium JB023]|nr:hypothetical protein [Verrucomicrobiota bacterium JB023]